MVKKRSSKYYSFAIIACFMLATCVLSAYASYRFPSKPQVKGDTTVASCTNYVSGPTFTKTSFDPGEKITYTCAFAEPDLNCNFAAKVEPRELGGTKFLAWTDATNKIASFEGYVSQIPGTYTAYCQLGSTPECIAKGVSACNTKDRAVTYTVLGDLLSRPSNLKNECLNNGSKVKVTWDTVAGNQGYIPRLDNVTNNIAGKDWYVDDTDYLLGIQSGNSLEKAIKPNSQYNFWVHTAGANNSMSDPINTTFTCSNLTCKNGFSDSFDTNNYSSKYTIDNPATTEIENGKATFDSSSRIRTQIYNGDFISILDISASNSNTAIPAMLARYLDDKYILSRGVKILYNPSTDNVESARVTSPNGTTPVFDQVTSIAIDPSDKPSAFKIERKKSDFRAYYKTLHSDWQVLGVYSNLTNESVSIRFGSDNAEKTSFDNFSLSCIAPAAPSNPVASCSPNGKTALLSWGAVSGASSYSVRLDDRLGTVRSFDSLTKPSYIATINPYQRYSWWAHATVDGELSNESIRQEFTCTPTATPKPTAKPKSVVLSTNTPTPEIIMTDAPTITPFIPELPTEVISQEIEQPIEPIITPPPVVKTNPVSRFFSWLASLFN